jgi:hypothetical protein
MIFGSKTTTFQNWPKKKFLAFTHDFYNWKFNHNGQDKNVPSQIKPIYYAKKLIKFVWLRRSKMTMEEITRWLKLLIDVTTLIYFYLK